MLLTGCGPRVSLPHIHLPHPKIFYRPEIVLGVPHFSMNPLTARVQPDNGIKLMSLIYDSLVKIQPDGQVSPDIANSWSVRDHYTSYVFHLNPHAKWWNGRPISVHDVAWSYALYANPRAPISPDKSLSSVINQIHIVNAGTVEIQLKYPDPAFLSNVVASGNGHPILPAFMVYSVPLKRLASSPIFNKIPDMMGSGPYRPVSANAQGVKWIGNPHYFLGAPKSRVLITTWNNSPAPDINWTSDKTDGHPHVLSYSGPHYYMLLYNSKRVPTALAKALPQMMNRKDLAHTLSHSLTPAYEPVIPGSLYTTRHPSYNPRAMLLQSGYKQIHHTWISPHHHRINFTILTANEPDAVRLGSAIHRQLLAEGWDNQLTTTPNLIHAMKTHAFNMALVKRTATPYPLLMQDYGFRSPDNYGQYNSVAFRQSAHNILFSPNPTAATKQALTALLQSPPGVFLLWHEHHIYINSHVQGFRINPFNPLSGIQYWHVMPPRNKS